MKERRIVFRKLAVRMLVREVLLDVAAIEKAQTNFRTGPAAQKIGANLEKGMALDFHLRGPVGNDDERSDRFQSCGEESQQIDRSDVCPMKIIDNYNQGVNGRDLFAKINQLSFHASWRAGSAM